MVEQKLSRTHQTPIKIFQQIAAARLRRSVEFINDRSQILLLRLSRKRSTVGLLDNLVPRPFCFKRMPDATGLVLKAIIDRRPVTDVQYLDNTRRVGPFTFTGDVPFVPAKCIQEVRDNR